MNHKKEVGSRIKQIRQRLGDTMNEFGKRFDPPASDSIVSRWERGVSLPSSNRLQEMSKFSNVSLVYITTGDRALSDFSEQEMEEAFKEMRTKFNKNSRVTNEKLKYNLQEIIDSQLSYLEVMFLSHSLTYLQNSEEIEISFLTKLLAYLNFNKDSFNNEKQQQDMTDEEILEDIEYETKEFKKFVKYYFGYDK